MQPILLDLRSFKRRAPRDDPHVVVVVAAAAAAAAADDDDEEFDPLPKAQHAICCCNNFNQTDHPY